MDEDRLTLVFEMLVDRISSLEQSVQKLMQASEHKDLLARPGRSISGMLHCGRPAAITRYFQGHPDPGSYLLVTCPDADFRKGAADTQDGFPHGPPRGLLQDLRLALGDAHYERVRQACAQAPCNMPPDVSILEGESSRTHGHLTDVLTELALRHRVPQLCAISSIAPVKDARDDESDARAEALPSNMLLFMASETEACTLRSIMRMVDLVFDGLGLPRSMDVHMYVVRPSCEGLIRALMKGYVGERAMRMLRHQMADANMDAVAGVFELVL